jgi:uncharacterized paraquat-inducible protein A
VADVGRFVECRVKFSTDQNGQKFLHLFKTVEVFGRQAPSEVVVDLLCVSLVHLLSIISISTGIIIIIIIIIITSTSTSTSTSTGTGTGTGTGIKIS